MNWSNDNGLQRGCQIGWVQLRLCRSQHPHALDARARKDLRGMRSFAKGARVIETGEVDLLVKAGAPFGAVGHVVDDALKSEVDPLAALAIVTLQLARREDALA